MKKAPNDNSDLRTSDENRGDAAPPMPPQHVRAFLLAGQAERPPKTAELLARRIVADITKHRRSPGDKLPAEVEMLAATGVGRGTLREALRYLELQGIIVIKPGAGGGPIVAEPNARALANAFALVLQAGRIPFRTIVQSRRMLEPMVAAEAARNAEAEGVLDLIEQSAERIAGTLGDTEAFLAENALFHEAIAWGSGNAVFAYIMGSLHWIIDGSSLGVEYPDRAKAVTIKAHQQLFKAIAAHDSERAADVMRKHNESFEGYLSDNYPETLNKIVRWE